MMSRGQKTLIFLGAVLAFSAALAGGAILSIRSHRSRPQETTSHY